MIMIRHWRKRAVVSGLSLVLFLVCVLAWVPAFAAQSHAVWRVATPAELRAVLPSRAPVVRERIETEMRSASGITDGHGRYVAGVVLITAGYSAYGKYSHFFLTQAPLTIGNFTLQPGSYLIGWKRRSEGNGALADALDVEFYDASSGLKVGSVEAKLNQSIHRVESIKIWPPSDRSLIQIGRFTFPYRIGN